MHHQPERAAAESVEHLIEAVRSGSADANEALGQLLDGWRDYLLLLANQELDSVLCPKAGASDLVQETLLEAQQGFDRFEGRAVQEWVGWLRSILQHNVANFARRYQRTEKRNISREVPLHQFLQSDSFRSAAIGPDLAANTETPSEIMIAREEAQSVAQALKSLPETYQIIIKLRYQDGCSFAEIGQRLERSAEAARKLWFRAIRRLSEKLEADHEAR